MEQSQVCDQHSLSRRRWAACWAAAASVLSGALPRKAARAAVPKPAVQESIDREDRILAKAERTIKAGKALEEEGGKLQEQESKVIGAADISGEDRLEKQEEQLMQKIRDTERKIAEEQQELEQGLTEIEQGEKDQALLQKKKKQVEDEENTLNEEMSRLKDEEQQLKFSEDRLKEEVFKQRRDRAPRVSKLLSTLQLLIGIDKV